jgi:hypothetical protein
MWPAADMALRCRPLTVLALCAVSFLTGAAWSTACLRTSRIHVIARGNSASGGSASAGSIRPKHAAPSIAADGAMFLAVCAAVKVGSHVSGILFYARFIGAKRQRGRFAHDLSTAICRMSTTTLKSGCSITLRWVLVSVYAAKGRLLLLETDVLCSQPTAS